MCALDACVARGLVGSKQHAAAGAMKISIGPALPTMHDCCRGVMPVAQRKLLMRFRFKWLSNHCELCLGEA